LIEAQQSATLGPFLARYKEGRTDVAASTLDDWKPIHKSLLEFFGDRKPLRLISAGDAADWRRAISIGRSENTIRKYTKIAKSLFGAALGFRLIDSNPFDGLKATSVENRDSPATKIPNP